MARASHVKGRQNEARAKRSHWLRRRWHTHGMVEAHEGMAWHAGAWHGMQVHGMAWHGRCP